MPTIVELPDSTEVEFPDGMDALAIRRELVKSFPNLGEESPSESTAIPAPGEQVSQKRTQILGPIGEPLPNPKDELARQAISTQLTQDEVSNLSARFPVAELGQPATLPRFGEEGTVARGISEVISGLGEFALNKPEEFAASLYPPTAAAIALRYGPEIGKQWLQDVAAGIGGDKEASGRAVAMLAAIGGPLAVKKGLSDIRAAKADIAYRTEYSALVDKMAREALDPSRAQLELAPKTAAELSKTVEEIKPAPEAAKPVEQAPLTEAPATEAVSQATPTEAPPSEVPPANISEATTEASKAQVKPSDEASVAQPTPEAPTETPTGPGIVGMGGATPEEFKPSPEGATAMKYRRIDEERVKRGLEPLAKPQGRSDQEVWDRAMAAVDADPGLPEALIAELRDKPRPISDLENHVLLLRKIDLRNEYARATRDIAQAFEDGRTEDLARAKVRRAEWSDRLTELEEASRLSGSERGRALRSLRVMADEEFNLAAMEADMRASVGGRRLTDAEMSEVERIHKEYQEKTAALEKQVGESERLRVEAETRATLAELARQSAESKVPPPHIQRLIDKVGKTIHDRANAARERLKGKLFSISPDVLKDLAEIGADNIWTIGEDFGRWSAKMIEDIGEHVKPHLQTVWDAAKKLIEDTWTTHRVPKQVRQKVEETKAKAPTVEDISVKIGTKIEKGERANITPQVKKLAELFWNQGIRELDPMIDALQGVLKKFMPEITRQETLDALSGRGRFTIPSQEEVKVGIRDLSTQARLVAHQIDVEARRPLPRTGFQPDPMSDAARRELQKLEELKRKFGVVVTDPAKQLASALQSAKTYIRNRMADLRQEIATRERIVKTRTPLAPDAELEAMRKEYEAVKAEHESIFARRELTDEQRIAAANRALDRAISNLENDLKAGKLFPEKKVRKTPSTPELESKRARLEALREQRKELRNLDEALQAEKARKSIESQQKALQKQIEEQERRLREGDLAPASTRVSRPAPPELEPLKQRRDELSRQLAEARKKPESVKAAEQMARQLEAMNKRIAELEAKIAAGDTSPRTRTPVNRPLPPELEQAKQKLESLNKQLAEMRKGPAKSPAEIALQAAKTRITSRIADLQDRLAKGDFSARKREPVKPDAELIAKQADLKRIQNEWEQKKRDAEWANRKGWQRMLDRFVRWERAFKLSSPIVFGKLSAAAVTRAFETVATETVGAGLGLVPGIRQIAKQAPREGGINVKAMSKALTEALTNGMRDAWETAKTGASNLDVVFGEKLIDKDFANIFGQLHGMLKAPVKRAEFTLSLEKRIQHALRNGIDVTDPLVMTRLATEALNDGYRSIFMQRGFSSDMFNTLVTMMEKSKKYQPIGEISARMARFLLPVVRVPINIVSETATGIYGLPMASARTMIHVIGGTLDKLDPMVADSIMRQFKKGSIGLGLMAIGYFAPEAIGGYDWREKRKPGAAKTGGFQLMGADVPRWLTHAPWFELLQFGATIRHVKEQHVPKTRQDKGITEGMWAASLGLIEETPFVGQMLRVDKIFEGEQARTAYLGELLKGTVVPQAVNKIAEWTDSAEKRKPETIMEHIETGVPGLRQTVPEAKKKR